MLSEISEENSSFLESLTLEICWTEQEITITGRSSINLAVFIPFDFLIFGN